MLHHYHRLVWIFSSRLSNWSRLPYPLSRLHVFLESCSFVSFEPALHFNLPSSFGGARDCSKNIIHISSGHASIALRSRARQSDVTLSQYNNYLSIEREQLPSLSCRSGADYFRIARSLLPCCAKTNSFVELPARYFAPLLAWMWGWATREAWGWLMINVASEAQQASVS